MNLALERIAPALTRAWVGCYTTGLPAELRAVRRAEVDSDLLEHARDSRETGESPWSLSLEILLRLVLGIPDDIGWRRETAGVHRRTEIDGRIGTMSTTVGQMRWMSVCAVLSGVLLIGARLVPFLLGMEGGGAGPGVLTILTGTLAVLGVLGLHLHRRESLDRIGRMGSWLLLAGWGGVVFSMGVGWFVRMIEASPDGASPVAFLVFMPVNIAFLIAIPLGFILIGFGLPGPSRTVPLAVGCYILATYVIPIRFIFPAAAVFTGNEAQTIAWGIGLAGIGFVVWSRSATNRVTP